jgi:hypothetical protein
VQVELSPAPVAPFTFQYQTFDIGPVPGFTIATPRVDYLETAGSLTLEPGQTMTSFTVTLLDDALLEGDEVVPVVVGQGEGVIPFANAGLRIIDDDSQRIAAPDVGFVNEADGQIVHVPITLSSVSGFDIDIPWKTLHVPDAPAGQALDPDDYIATSGTLRIPAGRLTGVVDIEVRGDRLREPDEFIVVSFEPPRGGAQLGGFFGLGFGVILDQR